MHRNEGKFGPNGRLQVKKRMHTHTRILFVFVCVCVCVSCPRLIKTLSRLIDWPVSGFGPHVGPLM